MFWHDQALRKAIKLSGSQAALARALKVRRCRINHWLNRDKDIPFEYAIAIEKLTRGKVSRYEFAPHVQQLILSCEKLGLSNG